MNHPGGESSVGVKKNRKGVNRPEVNQKRGETSRIRSGPYQVLVVIDQIQFPASKVSIQTNIKNYAISRFCEHNGSKTI